MKTGSIAAVAALSLLPLSAPAFGQADQPADGFAVTSLPYPGASATLTLSNGDIIAFDGSNVDRYDASGVLLTNLASFSPFVFPSFVLTDPSESMLVLGESSNGVIYEMPLAPATPNPVTTLAFNYDAVFEDATHVLVSAAALGFGLGNQVYRVDLTTGTTTQLVAVAGASGPIALDDAGNLFYGTSSSAFPAPPGSTDVLLFDQAALTGSPVLTEADATVVLSGLDGAASMAFDSVEDSLYLAINNFGTGVNRIQRVFGGPIEVVLEGVSGRSISNLEFDGGDGVAAYLGYQPATGGVLRYNTTDFAATSERNQVVAARPIASVSGPGTTGPGSFDVALTQGAPNGFAILYFDLNSNLPPTETVISLGFPLFLGLSLPGLSRVPGTFPVDGNGNAVRTFTNPGGLEGLYTMQFLVFDMGAQLVGSSTLTSF
ncbi:MAG TPA: hypothetical protein ENJ09_01675 [Planctomycetes bacterium]|nr:hypothetical protein [Planctomycetota bacterium]